MIINNVSDLKLIVKSTNSILNHHGIKLKNQRSYEIFAKSQGFRTDTALRKALPIFVETNIADGKIKQLIEQFGIMNPGVKYIPRNVVTRAANIAQPFPMVASNNGWRNEFSIEWDYGTISDPYQVHESNRGHTWDEAYGHRTSYKIATTVYEEEFENLKRLIQPAIKRVCAGYSYCGPEQNSTFDDDAKMYLDEISEVVENFEFWENFYDVGHVVDIFGEMPLPGCVAINILVWRVK